MAVNWDDFKLAGTPSQASPVNWDDFSLADQKPQEPSGLVRRALGDTAVSLAKGVIGTGEAAVGLANIPTAGGAGKLLEGIGYDPKAAKETLDTLYSPEQQRANQAVQQAQGFIGKAGAMLQNPSTIAQSVVESSPLMFGGGAVAQGLGKAGMLASSPVMRGAIGEGLVGAGMSAEGTRQETADGMLTPGQVGTSLASGAGTALIGAAGGKIAQKLGIGDVDTMLAQGAIGQSAKGRARRLAEGAITEGVLEEMPQSAQEQVWQNLALDRPWSEGVPEASAMGLVTGIAMGGPAAALPSTAQPAAPVQPAQPAIDPNAGPLSKAASMATQTPELAPLAFTPQQPTGPELETDAQTQERMRAAQFAADAMPFERPLSFEQPAQPVRATTQDGMPFERIGPEDYDTLNPIRVGEGELLDRERSAQGQSRAPDAIEGEAQRRIGVADDGQQEQGAPTRAIGAGVQPPQAAQGGQRALPSFVDQKAETAARKALPFANEPAAQKKADELAQKRNEPFTVIPHPALANRFAVVPYRNLRAPNEQEQAAQLASRAQAGQQGAMPRVGAGAQQPAPDGIAAPAPATPVQAQPATEAVTNGLPPAEQLAQETQAARRQEGAAAGGQAATGGEFDVDRLRNTKQLLEDNIATKRSSGEKVPQAWINKLAEVNASIRGESTTGDAVYSSEVAGHPMNDDASPILRNLIPIRVSSAAEAERKLFAAQDLYSKMQGERAKAEYALRTAKTAAQKRKASDALKALDNGGATEDAVETLRNVTLPELQRLAKEAEDRFGPAGQQPESDVTQAQQADQFGDANKMVAQQPQGERNGMQEEGRRREEVAPKPKKARKPDAVTAERAQRNAEELRAMSQDAGWSEIGGKLIRDANDNISRTSWIPRAEWFMAGMEARPDVLAQHIEDAIAGRWAPVKSRRTIEGMMEWLDAQRNQPATLDQDASMYDFEAAGYDELSAPARTVVDAFDDIEPMTQQDEAAAMRALGFTEQEIQDAVGQTQASAGSVSEPVTAGAQEDGAGNQEAGRAQAEAGQEGLTAEQKIRQAFNNGTVTLGVAKPITVQHNGRTQQFMARQDKAVRNGRADGVIHLMMVRRGKLLSSLPEEWILEKYKLTSKNQLVEEGAPQSVSEQEAESFLANFRATEPLALDTYTTAEIAQREAAQQEREAADRAREQEAERRAQADAERDKFTLSGSNRPADVLAAQGQGGLFEQPATPADRFRAEVAQRKGKAGQGDTIDVDGVSRPRTNIDGRPIHPTDEGIRNFWRWFGKSRVVDEQGRPRVMYHITPHDFVAFHPGGKEAMDGVHLEGQSGTAMWFSPSKQTQPANHNVRPTRNEVSNGIKFRSGSRVIPVYLHIERPLMIDDQIMLDWSRNVFAEGSKEFPQIVLSKWRREIQAEGYDGIVFNGEALGWGDASMKGDTLNEYIVFRPEQIKSATGNNGAFDPNEAPITLRRDDSVSTTTDSDPANQRITRAQADGFLLDFLAKFPGAPKITIVNTFDQLPATVQQEARNQGGNAGDTKGVFHRGQVYLVSGNHQTLADFEATVFHEVVGHAGVRALFGDEFVKTANRLFMQLGGQAGLVKIMQRRGMGSQASDYIKGIAQAQRNELNQIRADMAAGKPGAQRRWNDAIARFVLTEEVFAHVAEQVTDRPSMMDKMKELIGKVRQWLRDKGFAELADMGETDILFMLSKARESLRTPAGKNGGGGITRNGVTVSGSDLMTNDGRRLDRNDPDYGSAMRLADLLGLRQETGVTTFRNEQNQDDPNEAPITLRRAPSATSQQGQSARERIEGMARDIAGRMTGNPVLDPADPFAAENARLREQDTSLWKKAKTLLRRQLSPGGLLPGEVFAEKIKRDSEFQAVEFDVRHMVGGLERAVQQDFGVPFDKLTDDQMRPINEALAGKVPAGLPEATKTAAVAMRQYIDGLSGEYLTIIQGKIDALMERAQNERAQGKAGTAAASQAINEIELFEKIRKNIGAYVHRSYQAFDDPKWFEKVPAATLNAAREYLKKGYVEHGDTDTEAQRQAEVALYEILKNGTAYDSMEAFIGESKLGAKDLSVLMRRKEVPPQIRALLGEYTDPRLNFAKSTTKMGRLIWNQRFLDRIRDIGMGTFLFEGTDRPPQATKQIAAAGSEVYAPMNGLWTFPEVDQAFRDALGKEQMSDLYRFIVRANGLVKYGKTVISPTTAMRNWQSAMFFSLANGHFDMTQMKKSISAFREQVSQRATGGDLAYLRHLKQLGVVYDTPYAGEMMRLLQDARMDEILSTEKGSALRWFRKANQLAQGFYSFGDDFWKIIGFENEKAGLLKAGLTAEAAEQEAAKRIRDTYPTYSMVGRGVNWLSRFPLAGTFVSFPAEIIRTTSNMFRMVSADLKSDNPAMRKLGMRRAAGMAMVSATFFALAALSKGMAGVDDDEEEALRDLAPDWQKNSTFLFLGRDEKGQLRYFDLSFLDPYGYFKRPLTAMMRDQPWEDGLSSGLRDLLTPFLGADIAAKAIMEAVSNKKDSGGRVYKENDGPLGQAVDIADHLRKALQPGVIGNVERMTKAAQGVKREGSGQPFSMEDELVALVGWRASTMDPKTALYYRSFEFNDAITEARQEVTKTLRSVNAVSPDEILDARQRATEKQGEAFSEMGRLVQAARNAGMTNAQIMQVLRLSSVSTANIGALIRGDAPKQIQIGPQTVRNAVNQARTMQGDEFAREVSDRYRAAMAP